MWSHEQLAHNDLSLFWLLLGGNNPMSNGMILKKEVWIS
jgi:hypothetical protein